MFFFLVSLLGLVYCALCTEEACLYKAGNDCRFYTVVPHRFPGSEEELQNACTNLNQIKECIKDSVRNCSAEDVAHIEEGDRLRQNLKDAQKLLNVTTEICQEDSELHENFVLDMLCYREAFDTNDREQHCRDYTNSALNYIRSRVNAKLEGRDDERRSFYECLNVLFDMNCFLEKFVEKCSSRAKDTAIKIIEKGGSLEDQCPVSIRIDILELLDALKLVTRKDMHVRQFLETDSFFS
ncbi:hypothetical protein AVEN_111539-1 [Araneus ventricosus]|uniref:DUF19 domain-containing protein n=1 Tax=Araneus ventricosus TaxID=182803 RepID=A0A4Y2M2D0_ARAVE|nr:hypothetical protein AVEN_111539-1 [Araneus ventricosus]